jgi:nitrate reductase gamma subunit
MDAWIDFAKGPLFGLTFLIMVLGLGRLVVIQISCLITGKGWRLQNAPWRKMLTDAAGWILPLGHLIPGTKVFSTISYLFHIGVLVVPIFLAEHIVLWERMLGVDLPAIGRAWADFLTLFTLGGIVLLFLFRVFSGRLRSMSRKSDYLLLALIFLPFATGYMMMHPQLDLLPWRVAMLVHLLSAELLFVLIPFTKLAHIVLFFFDRISGLHWQLRPGAGDRVAESLFGKEARV